MDSIIQYHTGKTDIVLVKVPEGTEPRLIDCSLKGLPQLIQLNSVWPKVAPIHYKLPTGNWQIVGNPFEMNEEQWTDLLPSEKRLTWHWHLYQNHNGHDGLFTTAKESGLSLLNHLKVYQVNPLNSDPNLLNMYPEWQEAEERTGNWILLTAVKA